MLLTMVSICVKENQGELTMNKWVQVVYATNIVGI